jgi:hypothetical protein
MPNLALIETKQITVVTVQRNCYYFLHVLRAESEKVVVFFMFIQVHIALPFYALFGEQFVLSASFLAFIVKSSVPLTF